MTDNDTPEREKVAPEPQPAPFLLPLEPDDMDSERDNLRIEKNPVPIHVCTE